MAFDVYMAYMPLIQSTQHYLITDCVFLNLNSGKVSSWMRPVYGLVPSESNITLRTQSSMVGELVVKMFNEKYHKSTVT